MPICIERLLISNGERKITLIFRVLYCYLCTFSNLKICVEHITLRAHADVKFIPCEQITESAFLTNSWSFSCQKLAVFTFQPKYFYYWVKKNSSSNSGFDFSYEKIKNMHVCAPTQKLGVIFNRSITNVSKTLLYKC